MQIEVGHMGLPGTTQAARDLETRLLDVPGVVRAEVNATLGCVYAGFEPAGTDLEHVVRLVEEAEAAAEEAARWEGRGEADAGVERAPRAVGFPGGPEAQLGAAVQLGVGLAAVGVAVVGRAARIAGLPPVVPALIQLTEATPRLGGAAARRLGAAAAETGWATANLLTTTLTFRPLGPLVTTFLAGIRYAEAKARREAWQDWALRLGEREGAYRHDAAPAFERPVPLPPGPAERYADAAVPATLAGYGFIAAVTRSHDRALATMIAGTPRSPRLGRESLACAVGQAASARGGLVLRPAAPAPAACSGTPTSPVRPTWHICCSPPSRRP
ncbi:hypothetical protein [Streptomyces cupreus]|uniref:Uncharacterized protein n=1 Tax=Streptomyces cupreus TaxID=2759956 RepID=A0A7X1M8J0_9ACTN|nr:hypothetical protein [Streptomyces cupreus]MBC2902274.1 hypothetical protein [Streptomyces cupreus]